MTHGSPETPYPLAQALMTSKLLATAIFLVGCYTGVGPASEDTDSATLTATTENSAESGGAENQVIEIENFTDGKTLAFEIPPNWSFTKNEQSITAASFPPPHQGKAEAMPAGLMVRILSYHPTQVAYSSQQEISVASGTWIESYRSGIGDVMVTYTSQESDVALVGYRIPRNELDDVDKATIETILASISLAEGDSP